jgi:hypothetical protein
MIGPQKRDCVDPPFAKKATIIMAKATIINPPSMQRHAIR